MSSSETNAVKPAFNPIKILEGTSPVVRVMVGIALVGLIMVLISWAAPVLTPILLAGYLAAICAPLYFWLQRKGVNEHLALILLVVVVVLVVVFMAALLGISANRMTQGILKYQADLGGAEVTVESVLTSLGLQESDLNKVLTSEKVTSVLMGILGAIGDFAGDLLFSVVLIAFFLLEAKRFLRLAETQLSDRPFFGELPEVAKSAVTYFGIRTRTQPADRGWDWRDSFHSGRGLPRVVGGVGLCSELCALYRADCSRHSSRNFGSGRTWHGPGVDGGDCDRNRQSGYRKHRGTEFHRQDFEFVADCSPPVLFLLGLAAGLHRRPAFDAHYGWDHAGHAAG